LGSCAASASRSLPTRSLPSAQCAIRKSRVLQVLLIRGLRERKRGEKEREESPLGTKISTCYCRVPSPKVSSFRRPCSSILKSPSLPPPSPASPSPSPSLSLSLAPSLSLSRAHYISFSLFLLSLSLSLSKSPVRSSSFAGGGPAKKRKVAAGKKTGGGAATGAAAVSKET